VSLESSDELRHVHYEDNFKEVFAMNDDVAHVP
jgi:hypothetical protein